MKSQKWTSNKRLVEITDILEKNQLELSEAKGMTVKIKNSMEVLNSRLHE